MKSSALIKTDPDGAPATHTYTFAKTLGGAHRKTLAESEDLHKSYLKLPEQGKLTMKIEFMAGYVCGYLGCSRDMAETVITGRVRLGAQAGPNKPPRTREQQQAYDAARKMFGFHISRDDSRRTTPTKVEVKQVRLSSHFKESAVAFIQEFYEEVTEESIDEVIRMLTAMKQRLEKIVPALGLPAPSKDREKQEA